MNIEVKKQYNNIKPFAIDLPVTIPDFKNKLSVEKLRTQVGFIKKT